MISPGAAVTVTDFDSVRRRRSMHLGGVLRVPRSGDRDSNLPVAREFATKMMALADGVPRFMTSTSSRTSAT